MRITVVVLACCVLVLAAATPAAAEFYRWVDRDGREFFTNELEKIPAEYRASARPVEVHDERVSVGNAPMAAPSRPVVVKEHRDKNGRGEEYWKKRAENLRRQIRDQEAELDHLARQEQQEQNSSRKTSAKNRKKSQAAHEKKRTKIEKKIAKLKRELDVELPEEARKADAYPGWVRE